jgi:hypothetical protein
LWPVSTAVLKKSAVLKKFAAPNENHFFFSRCGPQWPTANFAFAFASWGK